MAPSHANQGVPLQPHAIPQVAKVSESTENGQIGQEPPRSPLIHNPQPSTSNPDSRAWPTADASEQHLNAIWNDWSGRGSHARFGRDEVVPLKEGQLLGHGGSGTVHEAEVKGIPVALKKIYYRGSFGEAQRREIDILKKLNHGHIIKYVGSYTHGQHLGLLLYPVAVCDLATFFDDMEASYSLKELDQNQQYRLPALGVSITASPDSARSGNAVLYSKIGCLATAIEYLHSQNIKHKDLKLSNILLSRDRMWLTDFGSATDFGTDAVSKTENGGGTPRYLSPEVAQYRPSSRATDIFSLGCVFLEILVLCENRTLAGLRALCPAMNSSFQANLSKIDIWFALLDPRSSARSQHLLYEVRRMLSMDPEERPTASDLRKRLAYIDNFRTDGESKRLFGNCCSISFMSVSEHKWSQDLLKVEHAKEIQLLKNTYDAQIASMSKEFEVEYLNTRKHLSQEHKNSQQAIFEQHANEIQQLKAHHESRISQMADQVTEERQQMENLEAQLTARLRDHRENMRRSQASFESLHQDLELLRSLNSSRINRTSIRVEQSSLADTPMKQSEVSQREPEGSTVTSKNVKRSFSPELRPKGHQSTTTSRTQGEPNLSPKAHHSPINHQAVVLRSASLDRPAKVSSQSPQIGQRVQDDFHLKHGTSNEGVQHSPANQRLISHSPLAEARAQGPPLDFTEHSPQHIVKSPSEAGFRPRAARANGRTSQHRLHNGQNVDRERPRARPVLVELGTVKKQKSRSIWHKSECLKVRIRKHITPLQVLAN